MDEQKDSLKDVRVEHLAAHSDASTILPHFFPKLIQTRKILHQIPDFSRLQWKITMWV